MASTLTLPCGETVTVSFKKPTDCGPPCLTLTTQPPSGGSGGGVAYKGVLECCGCNWAIFAFGDPALCSGTVTPRDPCANLLRLKVEYGLCPGWYCVRDAGTTGPFSVVEITDGDSTGLEIGGGPYSTESDAYGGCGSTNSCTTSAVKIPAGQLVTRDYTGGGAFDYYHIAVTPGVRYYFQWSRPAFDYTCPTQVKAYTPDCEGATGELLLYETATGGDSGCVDLGVMPDGYTCLCISFCEQFEVHHSFTVTEDPCP